MLNFNEYLNCKVIIHDEENGKTIAETIVVECDASTTTIIVASNDGALDNCKRVSVLILHQREIFESRGTVRRVPQSGRREIALFQGQTREDRTAERYTVLAPATIENLIIGNRFFPLRRAVHPVAVNISTGGVLIRTESNAFNVGTVFQLKLEISGSETILNSTVVRTIYVDPQTYEYGCKFKFPTETS